MLAGGELRQGALAGIVSRRGGARRGGAEPAAVRRAAMLAGDLAAVAEAALARGRGRARPRSSSRSGRPVQPMLAKTAPSLAAAIGRLERRGAVEWKLDGVRIQVHRDGDDVAVFTRTLEPVTERMPEVVEAVRALPAALGRARRRGDRAPPGRAAAAVPGDREPRGQPRRRRRAARARCR